MIKIKKDKYLTILLPQSTHTEIKNLISIIFRETNALLVRFAEVEEMQQLNPFICSSDIIEYTAVSKEVRKLIEKEIDDFLKGKDMIDTHVFYNSVMTKAPNGKDHAEQLTERRIANICGVGLDSVKERKAKLLAEFRILVKSRIEPMLIESA